MRALAMSGPSYKPQDDPEASANRISALSVVEVDFQLGT